MTHTEIRAARLALGLEPDQLAKMLNVEARTVRRMESNPNHSTHRKPAVRMVRLIRAYLDGHRPADWPKKEGKT
jgi:DNA-binding transcriptional regulator YiaG